MSKSILSKTFIPFVFALVLAFAPNPAFAQRGGGGHGGGGGGGFHGGGFGGGGFHGGGAYRGGGGYRGGGSFGGGRYYGASAYRGGSSGGARSYASRGWASSGFGRGFSAGRGYSARSGSGVRNAIADGQWHSFGGARGSSGAGASAGFHNAAITDGRNRGFGNGGFGNRGFGGRGFRGRGFGGCWGCGFGFGFGWGWGWPWALGWGEPGWGWDPYWYDPWWWGPYGYDAYPYGGYYEYGPPYAPPPDSDYGDYYSYGPPYALPEPNGSDYDSMAPNEQPSAPRPSSGSSTGNVAESTPTILLYLTDGTMYPATDYWVSGSTVHYVVAYGGESAVPIAQVDMQRTIDENTKRGVRFNLRPRSGSAAAAPMASAALKTPA